MIETTVSKLEQIVRHNAMVLNESIKNQEKMFVGQCKLVDKLTSLGTKEEAKQKSYADAVKGLGAEVIEQVSKKIEKMPVMSIPVRRSNEEVACLIDELQDKERRKLNVVVHNLEEADGQNHVERSKKDGEAFRSMTKNGMKLKVETEKTFRVGKREGTKPRLLVVTLTNMADKVEILRAAASLKNT